MENMNGKITVSQVVEALEELAPPALAMEWDNPGLQVGRRDSEVKRVYVALDVNDAVLRAAFEACCDMIVTHHPLIFGKIDKVNDGDHIGRWILMMAEEGIACYAMHTNFDIAPGCMADLCATRLGLEKASPLEETGTASRVSILDGELQEEETETIGIGKICRNLAEIPESYRGAREAVSYRSLYGAGKAINIGEIAPGEERASDNSQKKLLALFKAVKMSTPETVRREADAYVQEMVGGGVSLSMHRFMVMELISSLYRFAVSNRIDTEPIFGEDERLFRNVANMDSTQLEDWLCKVSLMMQEQMQSNRADGAQTFVSKAVDYVRDNYSDQELTIDKICGILGVSAAYFSTMFKKETGKTFIAYLTDYRMEQAVQRLIGRDEKTYVIAAQVGYADPAYFSYVFKKKFGVSPSRYRTERK